MIKQKLAIGFILAAFACIAFQSRSVNDYTLAIFVCCSAFAFALLFQLSRSSSANLSPYTVMVAALLMHVIGLFGLPLFEDDHYRYLWDGYRTVVAGNPYAIPPSAFFSDTNVPLEMQRVLDGINHPDVPTIYGPVLQAYFAMCYWIAPADFLYIRIGLCAANMLLIHLLLRNAAAKDVLMYALNPLVFKELALTGHPDGLLPLLLLSAWLLRDRFQPWLGSLLFALAVGVKISVLPVLGWLFFQKRWLMMVLIPLLVALMYMPFYGTGTDLEGLKVFASDWQFNPGPYAWVAQWFAPDVAKIICAALAAAIIMLIHYQSRHDPSIPPWHRVFGVLLLLSPVINAWYLLWLLPFAVFYRERWPWFASLALLLSYVNGLNTASEEIANYQLLPWAGYLLWIIVALAVTLDCVRHIRANPLLSKRTLIHNEQ